MATRRKLVRSKIAPDGSAVTFDIFGPADSNGDQSVVSTLSFNVADIPADRLSWFAAYGYAQIGSNRYNKLSDEDATPDRVRRELDDLGTTVSNGTWTPGRVLADREPSDLELAIAEATGTPIADLLDRIENEVHLDEHGNPKRDKAGRVSKVFTKSVLTSLAEDPAVKPIYARLVAERAKRLSAEAKRGGTAGSALSGLFAARTVEQQPEAAAAQ